MKELFIEKSLDFYLKFLNVDKKKFWAFRILLGAGLFLSMFLIFIMLKNPLFLIAAPILSYIGYKLPYFQIVGKKDQVDIVNSFLFPNFLRTFLSLLATQGNVYQTLLASVSYTEDPLKSELEKFVNKIEKKNNRQSYLDFAAYIGSNEAFLIMSMIYEFSTVGTNKDMMTELERYIGSIQQNKTRELKEEKVRRIERHSNLPLISVVGLVLVFSLSLLYFYTANISTLIQ